MKYRFLIGCIAAGALFAQAPAPPNAAATPTRDPGLYVTMATSMGNVVGRLYEKETPITVKNFQDLATGRKAWTDPKTKARVRRPLYNGLIFHRVIPGFMIQGGDPEGTGMGGTDVIVDEFVPSLTFSKPGIFGMANAGPGTGSSQFFITEGPTPHLNGRHTVFGEVIEGMDVVKKIANAPRNAEDRPNTPIKIVKMSFERVGPDPNPTKPNPAKPKAAKPKAAKPKATTTAKPKPAAAKP
ncbi:MAG TPA: peptidylprolyl isomerase [Bryobacteraceae bacterium]|nr:peptidylprolyl isomerase [Bryobacteraceae bacterium]